MTDSVVFVFFDRLHSEGKSVWIIEGSLFKEKKSITKLAMKIKYCFWIPSTVNVVIISRLHLLRYCYWSSKH